MSLLKQNPPPNIFEKSFDPDGGVVGGRGGVGGGV